MASFIDSKQREWDIRICGPSIDLVRETDPLFLLDDESKDQNTPVRLAADPSLLCHVIYALCKKQRDERGVGLDDFYTEVIGDGESIEAAATALEVAITNFTPPKKRAFITAVANKQRAVEELAMTKAMARLNDPALENQISEALDKNLTAVFGKLMTQLANATSSPASAESHPED